MSEDRRQAIVAVYKVLNDVNCEYRRLKLHGLAEETVYRIREDGCDKGARSGSELMRIGMVTTDDSAGERRAETAYGDFIPGFLFWRQKRNDSRRKLQKNHLRLLCGNISCRPS